jgi:hypothetical protein
MSARAIQPSRIRSIVASLSLLLAIASFSSPVWSQADPADAQARMAEAKARLKLTPDQEAKIKPLIQQSADQLKALRGKYGDAPTKADKRSMLKEARGIQQTFQTQVDPILNADQKAEWAKMKSEAKAKMREKAEERRAAGG